MGYRFKIFALCAVTLAGQDFQGTFSNDKKNLGVKGSNPYFPLTPGYKLSYRHGNDTDTLTVLDKTKAIDGVECRVIDCATGQDLGTDQAGELLIRTPAAMRGYLNNPSATAETIQPGGWLHTGKRH